MDWMATVKWLGTSLVLVSIGLTSANVMYPVNLWCGFTSCILWGLAAFRMRENSLFLIELVAGLMYIFGIVNAYKGA